MLIVFGKIVVVALQEECSVLSRPYQNAIVVLILLQNHQHDFYHHYYRLRIEQGNVDCATF
jgi:hypothetical protein